MGKGGSGTKFGYQVGDAATFGMASKNRYKHETARDTIEADKEKAREAAKTAAANAETARLAKIKEDEDALVRRNALLGAVKQRLSGRSSSNTRLSSAEM